MWMPYHDFLVIGSTRLHNGNSLLLLGLLRSAVNFHVTCDVIYKASKVEATNGKVSIIITEHVYISRLELYLSCSCTP